MLCDESSCGRDDATCFQEKKRLGSVDVSFEKSIAGPEGAVGAGVFEYCGSFLSEGI